jgi:small subunit ribosomal protein S20
LRNRAAKKALRLATRAALEAAASKDQTKVAEKLPQAMSLLDKAAQSGTLHWRTAAREKSRLAARVQRALAAAPTASASAKP